MHSHAGNPLLLRVPHPCSQRTDSTWSFYELCGMKRSSFLILRAFSRVLSKENFSQIALIMDTPFVETLLVLAKGKTAWVDQACSDCPGFWSWALPRGPGERSTCREAKIAARQFLPLNCRAITLTAGGIFRVHAKGVVLCEKACFCLLSTF